MAPRLSLLPVMLLRFVALAGMMTMTAEAQAEAQAVPETHVNTQAQGITSKLQIQVRTGIVRNICIVQ